MKLLVLVTTLAQVLQVATAIAQTAAPPAKAPAGQTPAAAKAPEGAEFTTATFGDWQLRCRNATAPGAGGQPAAARTCEVIQSVMIQGQAAPFAQLAFGKVSPSEPLYFTTVLPTNVAFPSTVKILVDEADKQPVELNWTRCIPGGCFASVSAKDDVMKRWRAQNESGRFIFKNGNGQDLTVPFSFRGLSRALDALAKEG